MIPRIYFFATFGNWTRQPGHIFMTFLSEISGIEKNKEDFAGF